MKGLLVFAVLSVIIVAWWTNGQNDANRQFVLQLAKYAATERPWLDQMCANYFEWSKMMNDRVPGMEKQCAQPFIEHTTAPRS